MNGVFLRLWYRKLDQYVGSAMKDFRVVAVKCVLDQLLLAPFSIVTYFSYSEIVKSGGLVKAVDNIRRKCELDFSRAWLMDCQVWPLANIICYGFVPLHFRVPFICAVQFGWQTYMANVSMSQGK